MMTREDIQLRILDATDIKAFETLERDLRQPTLDSVELFYGIFTLAIDRRIDRAYKQASGPLMARPSWRACRLLAGLEPHCCPVSCEEAVYMIAGADWNPSYKEIPYYLVVQFGKIQTKDVSQRLLAKNESTLDQVALDTILYWLNMPLTELLSTYISAWAKAVYGNEDE